MPFAICENPEDAALRFVFNWFELLAKNQWQEALGMIDEPTSYGEVWTEEKIKNAVSEYCNGNAFALTSPHSAGETLHHSTGDFKDHSGFWLDCDMPVDEKWTDLSAQFEFRIRGGVYLIALQDIHVL